MCKGQGQNDSKCLIFGPSDGTALKLARAEEHFQKSLPVDTVHCAIHKCRLKLCQAEKPYVNVIQKHCCLLWAKAHLKWTQAKQTTVLRSDTISTCYQCSVLEHHMVPSRPPFSGKDCVVQKDNTKLQPLERYGFVVDEFGC